MEYELRGSVFSMSILLVRCSKERKCGKIGIKYWRKTNTKFVKEKIIKIWKNDKKIWEEWYTIREWKEGWD